MKDELWKVLLVAVFSVLLIWLPFMMRWDRFWGIEFGGKNMQTIVQNFDGINFLIVEKTWYQPELIENNYASVKNWRENLYFAAHFPLYPILIGFFDQVMTGPRALQLAIVTSNMLLAYALWRFVSIVLKDKKELRLPVVLVALFFPARLLAVRAVGSNEPLFMAMIFLSLSSYLEKKSWWAGIWGALAVLTRSPGILLFGAYGLSALLTYWGKWKKMIVASLPYSLMPLSLLLLWGYYGEVYGSFWAYFQVGGNINLYWPPFLSAGTTTAWISGLWREELIYLYGVYGLGVYFYLKKNENDWKKAHVLFPLIYFSSLLFVVHRDLARYSLPVAPFVVLGASELLEDKWVRRMLLLLLVPVVLWSWRFVLENIQPVMDWSPFL